MLEPVRQHLTRLRMASVWIGLCGLLGCTSPESSQDFDFESGTLEGWTLRSGDLGDQPANVYRADFNAHGDYFIGTADGRSGHFDDGLMGILRSPTVLISHDFVLFRIGGGAASRGCHFALRRSDDDQTLFQAAGFDSEHMRTLIWDVSKLRGTRAYFELADHGRSEWGHLNVDYVRFRD